MDSITYWYTGSVSPGRLNKPRWDRDRHCLPISQAVGGGSHGQVVPACANPQTLRLIGVDGVFQSPLSSPINYCRPHPVWVGPVPDVTMLYDRAAGAEDKSVGCIKHNAALVFSAAPSTGDNCHGPNGGGARCL